MIIRFFILSLCLLPTTTNAVSREEGKAISVLPYLMLNYSTLSGEALYADGYEKMHSHFKVGYGIGCEMQCVLYRQLGSSVGLTYSKRNASLTTSGQKSLVIVDENQVTFHYLSIPLLLSLRIKETGLSLQSGIQYSVLLDATSTRRFSDYDTNGSSQIRELRMEDTKKMYKSYNLCIPLGLQFEFHRMFVFLRYEFGITNLNNLGTSNDIQSQAIELAIGCKL